MDGTTKKKVALTVRLDVAEYKMYAAILAIQGETQNDNLVNYIKSYIEENKNALKRASEEYESSKTQEAIEEF